MNRRMMLVMAAILSLGSPGASAQVAGSDTAGLVRVRYIVKDVAEAVAFYTGQLGFKVEIQSGPYFAALTRDGVQLLLSPVTGPGGASQALPTGERPAPGGWNRMVLNTVDVESDVKRLRAEGVRFRSEVIVGLGGNQVLLEDPSGNLVELFQPTLVVPPH